MTRARLCRVCGAVRLPSGKSVCDECSAYGIWWDQVARRPAMEVTGTITPAELARLVEQGGDRVRIMLHAVEAPSHRLLRYLGRGPDLLPVVTAVAEDVAGLSFSYRDRAGNTGELWRAKRMAIELLIDGQPVQVTTQ